MKNEDFVLRILDVEKDKNTDRKLLPVKISLKKTYYYN